LLTSSWNRVDIGVVIRIALAEVELWRDSQIALLRQAAANVADMFMHAENFLNHDNDRQHRRFRASMVGRHVLS
jgi:hypothetical protein